MEKYIDSKNLLATPFFNQKELPHRKFFRPLCSIVEITLLAGSTLTVLVIELILIGFPSYDRKSGFLNDLYAIFFLLDA